MMTLRALGLDIAKEKFDAALRLDGKYQHRVFANRAEGYAQLVQWLSKQGSEKVHTCMEATGRYGEQLALFLHTAGHVVSVVNPACIKASAKSQLVRNKTDKAMPCSSPASVTRKSLRRGDRQRQKFANDRL